MHHIHSSRNVNVVETNIKEVPSEQLNLPIACLFLDILNTVLAEFWLLLQYKSDIITSTL